MYCYSVIFLQKCVKGRVIIICGVFLKHVYEYGLFYDWLLCHKTSILMGNS